MKYRWAFFLGLLLLFSSFEIDKPVITIFMIGDSTMANKELAGDNPERGWGQMLPGFLSEGIKVENHAGSKEKHLDCNKRRGIDKGGTQTAEPSL